jgi:ssDNA-binding Zn-finger/Zn-ribbon topoisomerase 1
MKLRNSRYGLFYGCTRYPMCEGTHGAHPDGTPLGTPATKETRTARIAAHESFDRLWKSKAMSRSAAYRWMRRAMKMTKEEAHIGKMDFDQCTKLMDLVEDRLKTAQHKWLELQAKEQHDSEATEEEGGEEAEAPK